MTLSEATSRSRRATVTSRFGSSRRESHDASGFYDRFVPPELSRDEAITRPQRVDVIYRADARVMSALPASSVALVVTSPPYFAGKEYEESLGRDGVPGSYFEYLGLLRDVFAECKRVLEPGGRIAVNVANLGRRPYRSLSSDVTAILSELGLLLRGEIVWLKGKAAGGSCAWGTFQRPSNPVLRDVTERILVASKGRFDRAVRPQARLERGLPSTATITRDEFLEATTDLWEIAPESATRLQHPAPFPVELPRRLIELYTYEDDLVLDPFMGSGTTAVAAVRTGRHYVGYDTDPTYCARARARLKSEHAALGGAAVTLGARLGPGPSERPADPVVAGLREGLCAEDMAEIVLREAGFVDISRGVRLPAGVEVSFVAHDSAGRRWAFELAGSFATNRGGLKRGEVLLKAVGKAAVVASAFPGMPFVLLTTEPPAHHSSGAKALAAVRGEGRPVFDVVELLQADQTRRLARYARAERR